jgi:AcrR family transcriptional regulator
MATAQDWELAALEAIRRGGLAAVAIEPLARELGVTKGSFYWHFKDRSALLDAAIHRWEHDYGTPADQIEPAAPPRERLAAIAAKAVEVSQEDTVHARMVVEAASDPRVAAAVERITARRIDGLTALLRACGLTPALARTRATLLYCAFMGLQQLHRELPDHLTAAHTQRAMARALVDAAIAQPPGATTPVVERPRR